MIQSKESGKISWDGDGGHLNQILKAEWEVGQEKWERVPMAWASPMLDSALG